MTRAVAFTATLLLATNAVAETRMKVDCAKIAPGIARMLCETPDPGHADRRMATWKMSGAYSALLSRLTAAGREHLMADQARWESAGQRFCIDSVGATVPKAAAVPDIRDCLKRCIDIRTDRLAGMPGGDAYPFVSEMDHVEFGRAGAFTYRFAAAYPRFDMQGVGNQALSQRIAAGHRREMSESKPLPGMQATPGRHWTYDSVHWLHHPAPGLVTVVAHTETYLGGVHGNGSQSAMLVDFARGAMLGLNDVLDPASDWLGLVVRLCVADVRKQRPDTAADEPGLTDAGMRKLLSGPERWVFHADGVSIMFNRYDVGPFSEAPPTVELTYAQLKSVIRHDGPLASKVR